MHLIVVFDGLCNFCNAWTRFVLRRDRAGKFQFASAQSARGTELLRSLGLGPEQLETIVLIDGLTTYQRSDAVLEILKHLGALRWVSGILSLVPKGMRDWCYTMFARHRYRWFGKSDTCPVPDAKWRDRFIS